ncbi:MAG: TonB-dependent receptor [Bacteroidota bacterium]|nr:TonB-dependent receptor [Bacteroidota bacterium]
MTRFPLVLMVAVAVLLVGNSASAQVTVTGRIIDAASGDALPQATVIIEGSARGAATDLDGRYEISGLNAGTYTLTASFVGYESTSRIVTLRTQDQTVDFQIEPTSLTLEATEVFASRATDERTPVAYSNVNAMQIRNEMGTQDVPLVLNRTPSVYSTAQGGGAGDARVNVRGFNQRSIAILINGIPFNDVENGWMYWSNLEGLNEITSSIQVQRGLSIVNLATPSIGGTMNIITDPARNSRQMLFKQEFGSGRYLRSNLVLSTGLLNNKFAFTVSALRKTGSGVIDGTWTDSWTYFGAATWNISGHHRLSATAIGTPQRHGQNLFRQNLAVYDHDFAAKVFQQDGLSSETISDILEAFPEGGRYWNQNIAPVSSSHTRTQHNGFRTVRRKREYINEIENFFHKPIASLSYFGQLSDNTLLSSVLYYSGGKGGGSSLFGSFVMNTSTPAPIPDYDATIASNSSQGLSEGIVRNRHNVQWTIGGISKLTRQVTEELELEAGLDWRTAEIQHFSTVRDLLGGTGILRADNEFWGPGGRIVGLGERFHYNDMSTVGWIGGFLQGKLDRGPLSGFGVIGYSAVRYTFEDFFRDDGAGQSFTLEAPAIGAYQIKGGLSYSLTGTLSVYASAGRVSRVPVFDAVIESTSGALNPDPRNEGFLGFEAGGNFVSADRTLQAKLNLYHTIWTDRSLTRNLLEQTGNEVLVSIHGLNALHRGIEGELAWQPLDLVRLDAAFSFGDWHYTDDVTGTLTLDRANPDSRSELFLPLRDVKVGDAPQTQFAYAFSLFPTPDVNLMVTGRTYASHFAGFDPGSFTGGPVWQPPGYTVLDLQAGYEFSYGRSRNTVFVQIYNLADAIYVQDAINNSRWQAYSGNGTGAGRADDAEVFLGAPRTFSAGLRLTLR